MTTDIAKGVLLSTTLVSAVLLLFVTIVTRKVIFLLLILLAFGISGYFLHLIDIESSMLSKVGAWVDDKVEKLLKLYNSEKTE